MVVKQYIPDRGDIVWADLGFSRGREQAGERPLIVVSHKIYNAQSGLALMCPMSSVVKNYPFEVKVEGKKIKGVVLVDQIKSFDWIDRKLQYKETVDVFFIHKIIDKLEALIK